MSKMAFLINDDSPRHNFVTIHTRKQRSAYCTLPAQHHEVDVFIESLAAMALLSALTAAPIDPTPTPACACRCRCTAAARGSTAPACRPGLLQDDTKRHTGQHLFGDCQIHLHPPGETQHKALLHRLE